MRYIHHLIEQVLKFKKNPTLAQKSENEGDCPFFTFFFSLFSPTPTPYFSFLEKKKKSFNFYPISEWMPPSCSEEHQEHTYMPKIFFWIHQVRWGEPPQWSCYICLINLWREAPPLLTWWMKFFFGHIHVFLMFFQTIWWHSFWNLTKIERFLFFSPNSP